MCVRIHDAPVLNAERFNDMRDDAVSLDTRSLMDDPPCTIDLYERLI